MNRPLLLALVVALSDMAAAAPEPLAAPLREDLIVLKDAPGRDQVIANCSMCHSLDYIPLNSPFIKRANWTLTVTKMINAMGAPIREEDRTAIEGYLAANYGVD